ncbi:MAG: hypothetical protein ACP5XB_09370, partial [Isosphaeraceae bacterium]
DREAFHRPDLNCVVDQIGPIVGPCQGTPQRVQPQRISQQRTVVHDIMLSNGRPISAPNTAVKTRGMERIDSLTAVTSWTAKAMHQLGQRPPTGDGTVAWGH